MKCFKNVPAKVFSFIAVVTLGVTIAQATPLASSSFNHKYEGDVYNGSNPTLTGTSTSFTEHAGDVSVWAPSTDGDILTFKNTVADGGGYWDIDEWPTDVSNAAGWTVEFRIKIGTDGTEGDAAYIWFGKDGASTNSTRRASVLVGGSHTTIGNSIGLADSNDNTDDFHVFRIAQPASSSNITVWRDGVEIYDGLSKTSNNTGGPNSYFGDASGANGGVTVELDYFRWDSTGGYEPIPEPSTALLALIAVLGAGFVKRRAPRRG